jgi:hypothetical protein
MILSLGEINLFREVGRGRVRVEQHAENYDEQKNLFRGADRLVFSRC